MNKYIICCCKRPVEHYWALLKHNYGILTEFSYQIPQNQGFPDHHFELRELQGIMQNFSYKFHSFRFLLNETSNIYHSYQILISDSPQIKASRVTNNNNNLIIIRLTTSIYNAKNFANKPTICLKQKVFIFERLLRGP